MSSGVFFESMLGGGVVLVSKCGNGRKGWEYSRSSNICEVSYMEGWMDIYLPRLVFCSVFTITR